LNDLFICSIVEISFVAGVLASAMPEVPVVAARFGERPKLNFAPHHVFARPDHYITHVERSPFPSGTGRAASSRDPVGPHEGTDR